MDGETQRKLLFHVEGEAIRSPNYVAYVFDIRFKFSGESEGFCFADFVNDLIDSEGKRERERMNMGSPLVTCRPDEIYRQQG